MARRVSNAEVGAFWEANPVAAEAIAAAPGSAAFFAEFDRLREAPDCEPYGFSNLIHGYETAGGLAVLDVGCGNGYVLGRYARQGARVCGIDLTEAALALSRQRFALAGLEGEFRRSDGDHVPFADASFDIACAMGVLHHIEDPLPMLGEMRRVLKPGGRLILMLYHRDSWKARVLLPLRRLLDPRFRGLGQQAALNRNDGAGCPLARVYSRKEARALLEAAGFASPRFTLNQLGWQQLLLLPPLARQLAPLLPSPDRGFFARRWGWALYIHAERGSEKAE